jgi:hypothetical protein
MTLRIPSGCAHRALAKRKNVSKTDLPVRLAILLADLTLSVALEKRNSVSELKRIAERLSRSALLLTRPVRRAELVFSRDRASADLASFQA